MTPFTPISTLAPSASLSEMAPFSILGQASVKKPFLSLPFEKTLTPLSFANGWINLSRLAQERKPKIPPLNKIGTSPKDYEALYCCMTLNGKGTSHVFYTPLYRSGTGHCRRLRSQIFTFICSSSRSLSPRPFPSFPFLTYQIPLVPSSPLSSPRLVSPLFSSLYLYHLIPASLLSFSLSRNLGFRSCVNSFNDWKVSKRMDK